jgi:hypothetical protein
MSSELYVLTTVAWLCSNAWSWLDRRELDPQERRRSALMVLATPLWPAWVLWRLGWMLGRLASDVRSGDYVDDSEPSWRVLRCTARGGCRGQPVAVRLCTGDAQCAEHLCGEARKVVEEE